MEKTDAPETRCRMSQLSVETEIKGKPIYIQASEVELDGPGATEFVAALMRIMGEKK